MRMLQAEQADRSHRQRVQAVTYKSRRVSDFAERFRRGWEFFGPLTKQVTVSDSEVSITFVAKDASRATGTVTFSVDEIEEIRDIDLLCQRAREVSERVLIEGRHV